MNRQKKRDAITPERSSSAVKTRIIVRIDAAAEYMCVSKSKLRQLAWAGQLPFFQERKGALMLFEKADLDRWLDAHRIEC